LWLELNLWAAENVLPPSVERLNTIGSGVNPFFPFPMKSVQLT
jgi:hypothetical protein